MVIPLREVMYLLNVAILIGIYVGNFNVKLKSLTTVRFMMF